MSYIVFHSPQKYIPNLNADYKNESLNSRGVTF